MAWLAASQRAARCRRICRGDMLCCQARPIARDAAARSSSWARASPRNTLPISPHLSSPRTQRSPAHILPTRHLTWPPNMWLGTTVENQREAEKLFHSFEDRNTSGAARRAGTIRIATEIGGPAPVAMTVAGVMRVLHWAGVLAGAPAPAPELAVHVVQQDKDFVYALHDGMFEPVADLGDRVTEGDVAGFIHDPSRPFSAPVTVRFTSPGSVVCTRGAGPAACGDCLMHLGLPADAGLMAEFAAASALRWMPNQPAPPKRRRKASP